MKKRVFALMVAALLCLISLSACSPAIRQTVPESGNSLPTLSQPADSQTADSQTAVSQTTLSQTSASQAAASETAASENASLPTVSTTAATRRTTATAKTTTGSTAKPAAKTTAKTTAISASNLMDDCRAVWQLVNEERRKAGLYELEYADKAQAAADLRAQELIRLYSHSRPNGTSCFTAIEDAGVTGFTAMGENIAYGYTTPQWVMSDWMNSPSHRYNILRSDIYDSLVVGVAEQGGKKYWVQLFLMKDQETTTTTTVFVSCYGHHDYRKSEVVPPTETKLGYTVYVCSRCGESYEDDYVPAAKTCDESGGAHTWLIYQDGTGVCLNCGMSRQEYDDRRAELCVKIHGAHTWVLYTDGLYRCQHCSIVRQEE